MDGFELATIFVAPSDFQNFWETDPRTLMGVFGGTEPFLHHPSLGRGLGATGPRGLSGPLSGPLSGTLAASFGDLWLPLLGSLLSAFFSLLSSLLSLLSSRFYRFSSLCPPRGRPFSMPYRPLLGPPTRFMISSPLSLLLWTSCGLTAGPLAASFGAHSVCSPLSSRSSLFSAFFPLPS